MNVYYIFTLGKPGTRWVHGMDWYPIHDVLPSFTQCSCAELRIHLDPDLDNRIFINE